MPRIVVVDDNRQLAELLGRFLQSQGHEVRTFDSAVGAAHIVQSWPADLLITDINMPEMDGIELLTTVSESSGVPILATSGGGLVDKELLLDNAKALGARATFAKPFDVREVLGVIEEALADGPGADE